MMKNSKTTKPLFWACLLLCLIGTAVSGCVLIRSYTDDQKGSAAYDALQNDFFSDTQKNVTAVLPAFEDESEKPTNEPDAAEDDLPVPVMDFSGLFAINRDCVAWITLADTAINYPVVQGEDNAYYLSHLLSGEQNKYGTIFVDYRNNEGFTDKNTIIYGHHLKDDSMFSALENFKQQSFYDEHPWFVLYTPEKTYKLEPFAGVVITADIDNLPLIFDSDDAFMRYIETSRESSTFDSDLEIAPDDQIVTLCTCTYDFANARYALFCRLATF